MAAATAAAVAGYRAAAEGLPVGSASVSVLQAGRSGERHPQ